MHRALLVADEHVLDLVLVEERIVDRQHGAAGITEDVLDTLVLKRLDDHLGAGHLSGHRFAPIGFVAVGLAVGLGSGCFSGSISGQ